MHRSRNSIFPLFILTSWFVMPSAAPGQDKIRRDDRGQRTDHALAQLNEVCRAAYGRARFRLLHRSGPIVLSFGDQLILINGETRQQATVVPPLFHQLKAVSHVPLALFSVLDEAANRKLSKQERDDLVSIRESARQALPLLPNAEFSDEQLVRQTAVLRESLGFVEAALAWETIDANQFTSFARGLSERLLQNARDAARLKLDVYDRQLRQWWATFSTAERQRAVFVVVGASTPRQDNLAVQFFARAIGVEGEGPRIVYAESLFDAEQALNLAGTHLIDERVARGFFNEPRRMHRDLLGDYATEYLREMKPY